MDTVAAARSWVTVQPSRRSSSAMISTSTMSGTSCRVEVPRASKVAAISLSTLFLAPATVTSPASRTPPSTRNRSTWPA